MPKCFLPIVFCCGCQGSAQDQHSQGGRHPTGPREEPPVVLQEVVARPPQLWNLPSAAAPMLGPHLSYHPAVLQPGWDWLWDLGWAQPVGWCPVLSHSHLHTQGGDQCLGLGLPPVPPSCPAPCWGTGRAGTARPCLVNPHEDVPQQPWPPGSPQLA